MVALAASTAPDRTGKKPKQRKLADLLKASGNQIHDLDYVLARLAELVQRSHRTHSRERIGRDSGVNTSTIKDIYEAVGNPTLSTLTALLKYWGMSWEEFGRHVDGNPSGSKVAISSVSLIKLQETKKLIESALSTWDNLEDLTPDGEVSEMVQLSEYSRSRLRTLLEYSLEYQGMSVDDAAKALDLTPTTLAPFLGQLTDVASVEFPLEILDRIATICCQVKSWKAFPVVDPERTYKNWVELCPVLEVANGIN
ncbi:MAG: hypothetical protein LRZ84_14575 [Desertifilum sp.]|nr:hypothetical protein [Desertifilum sp.]